MGVDNLVADPSRDDSSGDSSDDVEGAGSDTGEPTFKPWMRPSSAGMKVPMAYMLKLTSAPERMIHQRVGMRSTLNIDAGASLEVKVSEAPRSGSGIKNNAGSRRNAGPRR